MPSLIYNFTKVVSKNSAYNPTSPIISFEDVVHKVSCEKLLPISPHSRRVTLSIQNLKNIYDDK
jgi:hypothetical protein